MGMFRGCLEDDMVGLERWSSGNLQTSKVLSNTCNKIESSEYSKY